MLLLRVWLLVELELEGLLLLRLLLRLMLLRWAGLLLS